jgi:glycosyltransferase involved in cell wall biosynthesis
MKILFVAMSQSIHTARWINQIVDEKWDIHLFPSWELSIHPQLRNVTIHGFKIKPKSIPPAVKVESLTSAETNTIFKKIIKSHILSKILTSKKLRKAGFAKLFDWLNRQKAFLPVLPGYLNEEERCDELIKTIQKVKPDIIHSLEIQHAGYLTLSAKKKMMGDFPTWIVTNWGADIHHFGEIQEHAEKIRATLEACDYYGCECQRDVKLARDFGFKGEVLPVLTNTGGFDFDYIEQFRQPGSTSSRKLVLLKGYQGWVYRALVGLKAIEMCADIFKEKGYRLAIYLASPGVPRAAMKLRKNTGIPVEFLPYTSHENMLKLHGQARVSMGLSMSDAISTSFLEAIVMGAFPIQSCTSCANEWVTSGETAFLVPPEDPQVIADALRRALVDDHLVDKAAEMNNKMLRERLDYKKVKDVVISTYQKIYHKESPA